MTTLRDYMTPTAAGEGGCLTVPAGESRSVVWLHPYGCAAEIVVGEGAQLELTELFLEAAAQRPVSTRIRLAAGSRCRVVTVALTGAESTTTVDLEGPEAAYESQTLYVVTGGEHCTVRLRVNHLAASCTSASTVKGIAAGAATGEFRGLVHVAPGAQHTDARQTSRNLLLSREARIVADPQLEIYADDVRCSHGATVGRQDDDAILYMRQRGLSEAQARRLQIEGFAADVVAQCADEGLREAVMAELSAKLEQI